MEGSLLDRCLPCRRSPVFWVVLAAKLIVPAFVGSHYVRDLFLPFLSHFIDSGFANPWDAFASAGRLDAFPYSGPMLAILAAPQALATLVLPGFVRDSEAFRLFLVRLPMLAADLAVFAVLCRWFADRRDRVLWLYWCSPILFYISYVHGQIDVIPSAFLFLSLLALFSGRELAAGVLLGVGLGTKLHLLVVLPFVAVHLVKGPARSRSRTRRATLFFGAVAATTALLIGPLLPSDGYRAMVLGTSETQRLFELAVPLAGSLVLYAGPAALVLLFLRFLSSSRVNRDLTLLFLALVFGVLVLLLPPMPGWYFWSLPLACYFYVRQEQISTFSYWLVNGLYILYYAVFWTDPAGTAPALASTLLGTSAGRVHIESLVFTALQGSLAMTLFWIYRVGVQGLKEYAVRERPVVVGIGGDSSSGKHMLADLLEATVGPDQASRCEGDDYHRWARGDDAWKTVTHLDPKANFVFRPAEDLWALRHGRPVTRPQYDHRTGTFTEPVTIRPGRFVFHVGLHPFYLRRMRSLIDLKVYMDPDEGLRRQWKTRRDQSARGHTPDEVRDQIERRLPDAKRHIRPQRAFADWIVRYVPVTPIDEAATADAPESGIRVQHVLRNDLPVEAFVAELSGIPGVRVTWDLHPDLERQLLEVEGDPSAADVRAVANRLFPLFAESLGVEEVAWQGGQAGVQQLVFALLLQDLGQD